jgi:hypothetical protein
LKALASRFSSTSQGGGKLRADMLFGDVHPAEAESLCNSVTGTLFAFQNFVEPTAISMMPLRKGGLTTLTFNSGFQHAI